MSLDFRDQYFGCEIEMTGLTRQQAANALATLFGTSYSHHGGYDGYHVIDPDGKDWKLVRDISIDAQRKFHGRILEMDDNAGDDYKVEMVSPKLEYSEMQKLQEVVRCLRHAGAFVNESCGMHVHIDASKHDTKSLKNALSIMYSKEDILFAALKVNEERVQRYCRKVDDKTVTKARKLPNSASTSRLADVWYEDSRIRRDEHYNDTRYHALNLHSVFTKGTMEFRLFESTLHAGEVRANITLALAISAQAINQSKTLMRKTPIGDNPAFTFRTFLLRLGLIGPEFENVRKHLLKNLPGDKAWRYDRSQYPCNQPNRNEDAR